MDVGAFEKSCEPATQDPLITGLNHRLNNINNFRSQMCTINDQPEEYVWNDDIQIYWS